MEHQRCYVYKPPEKEERPTKRQRKQANDPDVQLHQRLAVFRDTWAKQNQRIQDTLEEADSATQEKIVNFIIASSNGLACAIPTALIVAGPSIASHGPFFERLGRKVTQDASRAFICLTSSECPNLKALLKTLIKKATWRVGEDDEEEDGVQPPSTSRSGSRLLNYDLGHVLEWKKKSRVSSIVVAIQDSEAFDAGLLTDMVDLFHSWLDRLPIVLLFGIATSAESFEERLSGNAIRYLEGEKFDVIQSDDIIEKLFRATVANPDAYLRVGPTLCRRMLDRQKDHVQSTQDFYDGLKYAYMSHFYASYPSIFLKEYISFEELSPEFFESIRNLPSFRRHVEEVLEAGQAKDVLAMLESDKRLFAVLSQHVKSGHRALSTLSHASQVLASIREALQILPKARLSTIWVRAAAGELLGSPLLRETMLMAKKISSDKLVDLFASVNELVGDYFPIRLTEYRHELESLLKHNTTNVPLRTQHDVRNDSLRTTVVAQKVLLSKHKAALSEQDRAYSDLVGRFHNELENYFTNAFIDPRTLFLSEILIYDLKSPHTEVFQARPRFAIERALASPHDYLGCGCCTGTDGNAAALSATQPATAIVYQMYLESGALLNVSDLWSAFNAIAGDGEEGHDPKIMALFQRALAELKYLGLVKPSRKKIDHVAKTMWKGL